MNPESLISSIIVAVIGLAIVAVLVSDRAKTSSVINASGTSLANVIAAAVSPVTGNTVTANTGGGGGAANLLSLPTTLQSLSTFGGAFN